MNLRRIFGGTNLSQNFVFKQPATYPFSSTAFQCLDNGDAAPHLLAKLPRTTRPDAATYFGNVCAVHDGLKRRRKEICAAIDGDSISIYEVLILV